MYSDRTPQCDCEPAGLLGLEREAHDKPAGIRTFAVVGIGA